MNRNIKSYSTALRSVSDKIGIVELKRANRFENHDVLSMYDDEFYVVEMEDERFWASPNFNPDEDRALDDFITDVAEAFESGNKILELPENLNPPNFYGAYFQTVDEAIAAVHVWKITKRIPKDYTKPLLD